jgi:predicted O-methyltransferase YrrM
MDDNRVFYEGAPFIDAGIAEYATAHTSPASSGLAALLTESDARFARSMLSSDLVETRLLEALVVATRATRVLDIGTFTGASALAMASRLPAGSKLITLEKDPEVAEFARSHFEVNGLASRIEVVVGDALESLDGVSGPFELVFVDAWKQHYWQYFEAVLPKLADNGIIVCDNVLWRGLVLDPPNDDLEALGVREFARRVQQDTRVDNALLTVGDGLLLIWNAPR